MFRNWGYDSSYKPTLERSTKKKIMDSLGGSLNEFNK